MCQLESAPNQKHCQVVLYFLTESVETVQRRTAKRISFPCYVEWLPLLSQTCRNTLASTCSVRFALRATKTPGYCRAFTRSVPAVYRVHAYKMIGLYPQSTAPYAWMRVNYRPTEFRDFRKIYMSKTYKTSKGHLPHYPSVTFAPIMRWLSATVKCAAATCVNFVSRHINDSEKRRNIRWSPCGGDRPSHISCIITLRFLFVLSSVSPTQASIYVCFVIPAMYQYARSVPWMNIMTTPSSPLRM